MKLAVGGYVFASENDMQRKCNDFLEKYN